MASRAIAVHAKPGISAQFQQTPRLLSQSQCICRSRSRNFSSTRHYRQQSNYKDSFGTRLRKALGETRIKWYPIPVYVGIGFLGLGQLYRVNEREKRRRAEEWENDRNTKFSGSDENRNGGQQGGRPKRRERIRPSGPWCVYF